MCLNMAHLYTLKLNGELLFPYELILEVCVNLLCIRDRIGKNRWKGGLATSDLYNLQGEQIMLVFGGLLKIWTLLIQACT